MFYLLRTLSITVPESVLVGKLQPKFWRNVLHLLDNPPMSRRDRGGRDPARREQARRVNAGRRDRFAASAASSFAAMQRPPSLGSSSQFTLKIAGVWLDVTWRKRLRHKQSAPRTPLRETPPCCFYQCFRRAKFEWRLPFNPGRPAPVSIKS